MKAIWIMSVMVAVGLGSPAAGVRGSSLQQRGTPTGNTARQTETGTVIGTVRNPYTKEPIDSVNISFTSAAARGRRGTDAQSKTITDSNGRFTLSNLAPGAYNIRADREGYFGPANQATSPAFVTEVVNVSSAIPANVVLELIPGGSVRGNVYGPDGRPVSAAQVVALRGAYQDGHLAFLNAKSGTTDDRGEFRIWGLPPGKYYLRAETRTSASRNQQSLSGYYPSELVAERAQAIELPPGREIAADVHLPSATPVKISGRIVGIDPTIPGSVTYLLVRRDSQVWDNTQVTPAASNRIINAARRGRGVAEAMFELQADSRGRYDVFAVMQTNAAATGRLEWQVVAGRVSVEVVDQNIGGLTVTLRPTFDIRARFVTNGDPQIGNQIVGTLNVRPRDLMPTQLVPRMMTLAERNLVTEGLTGDAALQAMAASGTRPEDGYRFSGIMEGRYFLDSPLGQLRDAYVADIRQGGKSIYEDGTIVVGPDPPAPVEVLLSRPAGTISGTVQDSTNKPVGAAQVVLIPDGRRRENPLFYKRAISSAEGQFTLQGLAPGQYKLFAWENLPSGAERNAQFLARFEQFGRSVTVTAGSTVSIGPISVIRERQ